MRTIFRTNEGKILKEIRELIHLSVGDTVVVQQMKLYVNKSICDIDNGFMTYYLGTF